jgi:hypothetical protein
VDRKGCYVVVLVALSAGGTIAGVMQATGLIKFGWILALAPWALMTSLLFLGIVFAVLRGR